MYTITPHKKILLECYFYYYSQNPTYRSSRINRYVNRFL